MDKILVLVVSGPSGVGKSTLLSYLPKEEFYFSVSHTTRPPRRGERPGQDYYFVKEEKFLEMIEKDEFLEWVKVHSYYYGTAKSEIDQALSQKKHLVFDVEVIGAGKIKAYFGGQAISIFIAPPDLFTLKERLEGRGTEDEEKVKQRLERAKFELSLLGFYDYVIVNNNLERAKNQLFSIVEAELCRPFRQKEFLSKIF